MLYMVPFLKSNGSEVWVLVKGLERITNPQEEINMPDAVQMFGVKAWEVQRPSGDMDLLLGIKAAGIFPTVEGTEGNLRLLHSQFGTG